MKPAHRSSVHASLPVSGVVPRISLGSGVRNALSRHKSQRPRILDEPSRPVSRTSSKADMLKAATYQSNQKQRRYQADDSSSKCRSSMQHGKRGEPRRHQGDNITSNNHRSIIIGRQKLQARVNQEDTAVMQFSRDCLLRGAQSPVVPPSHK